MVGNETEKEMGGSEYYNVMNIDGGSVPKSEFKILKNCMKGLLSAIDKETIASCHDISEGGLGVCISEMCIGGNLGCKIDITDIGKGLRSDIKLFSESNTRWIVEVKKDKIKEFEKTLGSVKSPFLKIGQTKNSKLTIFDTDCKIIDQKIDVICNIWKNVIWNFMG